MTSIPHSWPWPHGCPRGPSRSRNVLVRAIRQAERDGPAARNAAALVKPPKGQRAGRPSKSLTLEQAMALMDAAKGTRLEAYITLSLLAGLGTEEARGAGAPR